MTPCKK